MAEYPLSSVESSFPGHSVVAENTKTRSANCVVLACRKSAFLRQCTAAAYQSLILMQTGDICDVHVHESVPWPSVSKDKPSPVLMHRAGPCSWFLLRSQKSGFDVTLYESEATFGGHTLTDETIPGVPVDLGFQVLISSIPSFPPVPSHAGWPGLSPRRSGVPGLQQMDARARAHPHARAHTH